MMWHREHKPTREINITVRKAIDAQELRDNREVCKDEIPVREADDLCSDLRLKAQLARHWLLLSIMLSLWHVIEVWGLPCFPLISTFCHCSWRYLSFSSVWNPMALRATWSKSTVGTWASASRVQVVLQMGLQVPLSHGWRLAGFDLELCTFGESQVPCW